MDKTIAAILAANAQEPRYGGGPLSSLRASNDAAEEYIDAQAEILSLKAQIAGLQSDLASAHEHVGALTTGGVPAFAAAMMLRQLARNGLIKGEYTLDEARICVEYFEQAAFGPTLADARTWLRRGAK